MKKNIPLYILLFFLIIVNGFFLYNSLGNPNTKKENGRKNSMSFVIQQLEFDDSQLQKMKNINKQHHHKMRQIGDDVKELKDALFNRLSDTSVNNATIDSITSLIGQKEKEKEIEAFYHFKKIQEICNDKQKEKFKNIINDALRKGGERDQRPPHFERRDGDEPPPKRGLHEGPPPPKD